MPNETPAPDEAEYRPYEDPELIELSGGSKELLNRLVAWKLALKDLEAATGEDREKAEQMVTLMGDEVARFREELGFPRSDTPGADK